MRLTEEVGKRVDVPGTARRFQVTHQDVRDALAQVMAEKGGEISISISKRREEMTQYIRHMYDECAKSWNFQDMVHMLATYHTELIARGIVNPERFGKEAAKVAADVAKFVYPKETAKVTRRLPSGETKEEILARLVARLGSHQLPPSTAIVVAESLDDGVPEGGDEGSSFVDGEIVTQESAVEQDSIVLGGDAG